MKSTKDQILQRCQDIVDGNYPANGREVYGTHGEFTICYNLFYVSIRKDSGDSLFEKAEFLLGMDQPPAEIELEWKEDELGRIVASFNDIITATCYKSGLDWFACIEFDGIPTLFTSGENNYGASTIEIARAWCVEQIAKIITPTK